MNKFINIIGYNNYKIYLDKRKELLSEIEDLDINLLTNGSHYFNNNNVFIYKLARILSEG